MYPDGPGFYEVIVIREDEAGYWHHKAVPTLREAVRIAAELNEALGLTDAEVLEIRASSMRAHFIANPIMDVDPEALDELVHQVASEMASNAINSSEQVSFLLGAGWTREEIAKRLS